MGAKRKGMEGNDIDGREELEGKENQTEAKQHRNKKRKMEGRKREQKHRKVKG